MTQNWRRYLTDFKQGTFKKDCHKGNTAIYQEKNGGTLYIGGWNNGAYFDSNTHVIDLTGTEYKYWDIPMAFDDVSREFLQYTMKAYAGWLSLPFPDYGVPAGMTDYSQWVGMAKTIQEILKKGNDVLVACAGGHGRSGLFCSIVGYILNIKHDSTWASPVEKLRELHCEDAVETLKQEQFVYAILGLRITINHSYYADTVWTNENFTSTGVWKGNNRTYKDCPLCGTQSMYINDFGMCLTCQSKYKDLAATRYDLTTEDITGTTKDWLIHPEQDKEHKCMGIWKAEVCGHVVHDQIIYEGLCENCYQKLEEYKYYEGKAEQFEQQEPCAICNQTSGYSDKYGVCYDCSEKLIKADAVDDIHNSITDPYHFVEHSCDDKMMCIGIMKADVCGHVVHDREIEEGLCPICFELKHGKKENK